jgi:hypothetical protein
VAEAVIGVAALKQQLRGYRITEGARRAAALHRALRAARGVRRLDFKDHRRDLDRNRYVYAVVSRRARGLSIGVNLNPDKVCNFDCPYCQVDRTTPGASPASTSACSPASSRSCWSARAATCGRSAVRQRRAGAAPRRGHRVRRRRRADDAARVPGCRPRRTRGARPAGPGRAAAAADERDALPQAEGTRRARAFDELWCKLDAGTEAYFQLVDGTRLPFRRSSTTCRSSRASGRS